MAGSKRTDKRGRSLRTGECQRKDGRYQFQYKNSAGKRQCVYDTTLSGVFVWLARKREANPKRLTGRNPQRGLQKNNCKRLSGDVL